MPGSRPIGEPATAPKVSPIKAPVPAPAAKVPSIPAPAPQPPPATAPKPQLPKYSGGAVNVPPGTRHLDGTTFCRGLSGDKLSACLEQVADFNDLHSTATRETARREAGKAGVPVGVSVGANGQIQDTTHTYGGASSETPGGAQRIVEIRKDTREGFAWSAFLKWTDRMWQIHGKPIADQITVVNAAIAKIDEENSFVNRFEAFISNPLALISTAIAAYATSGVAAGAVLGKLVSGDDTLDAASRKLKAYRDQLQAKANKVPTRAAMELIAPVRASWILYPANRLAGMPAHKVPGNDPYPAYYGVFLEDVM